MFHGYTPGSTNIAVAGKWTRIESMYFLLKMGIFQPAMLVYQRVAIFLGRSDLIFQCLQRYSKFVEGFDH